jgi:hypothetical protein
VSVSSGKGAPGSSQTNTVDKDGVTSLPPGSKMRPGNRTAGENVVVVVEEVAVDGESALEPEAPVVPCAPSDCVC